MNTRFVREIRWIRKSIAGAAMLSLLAGSAAGATLSGTISHDDPRGGLYYVYVVRVGLSEIIAGADVLAAPGRWEISGVGNGSYFVFAWNDLNHDFLPSRGEAVGFYGIILPQGVIIENNRDRSGINFGLAPLSVNAELRGRVIYEGPLRGRIWVVPHLGPDLIATNVRGAPVTMTEPGSYKAWVFQSGEYYVSAYLDVNGNLFQDDNEPAGVSQPRIVEITPAVVYSGLDIVLSAARTAVEGRTWSQVKSMYD
jgi:hypothetical protein